MRKSPLPAIYLRTHSVALPATSTILGRYAQPNLADAWSIQLPDHVSTDPKRLAQHLFDKPPGWVAVLLRIRDCLVAAFGLKTAHQLKRSSSASAGSRIGFFRIYEQRANEIVLGEDDKHLDFRLSVTREESAAAGARIVIATVVKCHNLLGRIYLCLIAPFHRAIVRATLRRAARVGWPRPAGGSLNLLAKVCQQLTQQLQ